MCSCFKRTSRELSSWWTRTSSSAPELFFADVCCAYLSLLTLVPCVSRKLPVPSSGTHHNMGRWCEEVARDSFEEYSLLFTGHKSINLREAKAYKSLDAYNYVLSGWVGQLLIHEIDRGLVLLKACVQGSQSTKKLNNSWIAAKKDGEVLISALLGDHIPIPNREIWSCSSGHADLLREKSWGTPIVGMTVPHPMEYLNVVARGTSSCNGCSLLGRLFDYVTVCYSRGFSNDVEIRGPLPAYLGSLTTESAKLFHP